MFENFALSSFLVPLQEEGVNYLIIGVCVMVGLGETCREAMMKILGKAKRANLKGPFLLKTIGGLLLQSMAGREDLALLTATAPLEMHKCKAGVCLGRHRTAERVVYYLE